MNESELVSSILVIGERLSAIDRRIDDVVASSKRFAESEVERYDRDQRRIQDEREYADRCRREDLERRQELDISTAKIDASTAKAIAKSVERETSALAQRLDLFLVKLVAFNDAQADKDGNQVVQTKCPVDGAMCEGQGTNAECDACQAASLERR